MKHLLYVMTSLLVLLSSCGPHKGGNQTKILLIPLDDRPPCLQFTQRMAMIADAEIISPPKQVLGHFTEPGKPDAIITWLEGLNLKSYDAAIVSIDMLAYGGLVASREYQVNQETATSRLHILKKLKERAPGLKIYAQSVIMRIAPTGGGKYEKFRPQLAEWGLVSVGQDEASKKKTMQLEQEIPAAMIADYMQARKRNLGINLDAIAMVKAGIIDYLLVSQDDAHPQGVHVADRKKIISRVEETRLENKIAIQPGADEVSMLLLARFLNKSQHYAPLIKVIYSSEEMSHEVMPFEDKPLSVTVDDQIASTGSGRTDHAAEADILFYVFTSREENGAAERFGREIAEQVRKRKEVMVADIDPKGNVQGGDSAFAMSLENQGILPELNSYASWNTAGNTIGTSLSQGVIYSLSLAKLGGPPYRQEQMRTAQHWFTFHRMLDDFYYHTLVRGVIKQLLKAGKLTDRNGKEDMKQVLAFSRVQMEMHFDALKGIYFNDKDTGAFHGLSCAPPQDLHFSFPWNRTFEALINFNLQCKCVTD